MSLILIRGLAPVVLKDLVIAIFRQRRSPETGDVGREVSVAVSVELLRRLPFLENSGVLRATHQIARSFRFF